MNRIPPELINYENQMDDFLSEHRRKNLYVVDPEMRKLWMDAHVAAFAPKPKPWKLKALIAIGLMMWFAYEFGEYVLRMVR